ncbi:hypothetical protein FHR32_002299 [Streptosporangium album]|uniref:DUF5666 domain-containing protein n=1 Tax=Streptosporangium album TaxID=47479 RepID=A0A7W7W9E5_9ACTN|nr:hypothetical protein [Streptosporangium album]MBB4937994.1 hypothetical protein [Streptosporangium album]
MGGNADEAAPAGDMLETSPFRGDLDSELVVRPRRGLSRLTLVLGAGVMLVAGVIVGIQAQKAMGGPAGASGASGARSAAVGQGAGPGGYGGGGGFGGFGGRQQGGGGQGGAVGTVQRVDGTKLYVTTMDGSVVTVNTSGETAVRVTKKGKVTDLKPGGTVVVQGAKAEDGSITATAISEGGGGRR